MRHRIRIAAIGLGWVTNHRHIPTILADGRYELRYVVDRRSEKVEAAKAHYRVTGICAEDLSDGKWLSEVDAVSIGVCPHNHAHLIRAALSAGKHVITEKPFTMSVEEGEELADLAVQRGICLAVVHNFQFATSMQKLERDLAGGRIGTVRHIQALQWGNPLRRLPLWYDSLPLGLFYDESPHLLYLLRRTAPGPIELVSATALPSTSGKNTPSAMQVAYRCKGPTGDIPVSMELSFETPVSEWHLVVHGDTGLGDVDIFRDVYIYLPNDRAHDTLHVLRTSLLGTAQHWSQHFTSGIRHLRGTLRYGNDVVFGRFAAAVLDGEPPLDISATDALGVLRMQHEILHATQGN